MQNLFNSLTKRGFLGLSLKTYIDQNTLRLRMMFCEVYIELYPSLQRHFLAHQVILF